MVLAVAVIVCDKGTEPYVPTSARVSWGQGQGRVQGPRIFQSAAKCLLLKAPQGLWPTLLFYWSWKQSKGWAGPDTVPPPQDAELLVRQTRFFLPSSPWQLTKG